MGRSDASGRRRHVLPREVSGSGPLTPDYRSSNAAGQEAEKSAEACLLLIIRRFLQAGMMQDGLCVARDEGTPQGGPLSPLLANLLLDDLDQMLDSRGHRFC
jgi:hypothetical protein